jgi:predicted CXXCH cytochrome family protein
VGQVGSFFGEPFFFGRLKTVFKEEREMLNKKLVLGSLAGASLLVGAALLLPGSAAAALMSGTCANCHTMHNSQNGADENGTSNGLAQLLKFNGCIGCHATSNNLATGISGSAPYAPQVGSAAVLNNAGGYFADVADANQHNVTDLTALGADGALTTSPGGAFAQADLTCVACHGGANGGHHTYAARNTAHAGTASSNSYRMLWTATGVGVQGTGSATYGQSGSTSYGDAESMNAYCAECHGGFHGSNQTSGGEWIRHPTDVSASITGVAYDGSASLTIPTSATNDVLCISCHRPHGSANADLLRFSYAPVKAGDGTQTATSCETCHGAK